MLIPTQIHSIIINSQINRLNPVENSIYSSLNKIEDKIFQAFQLINAFHQKMHNSLGKLILPAQDLPEFFEGITLDGINQRKYFFLSKQATELSFQKPDGTKLNGMYIPACIPSADNLTVILFNANGIRYEYYGDNSAFLLDIELWINHGCNVVLFNYSGVGQSQGVATRDGLISDGETVLNEIKNKYNLEDKQILIHGHSLGAAIGIEIAAKHPNIHYCNDRSFSSLSQEVRLILKNKLTSYVASKTLSYFGWEYDAVSHWEKIKGKKCIVYHEEDTVILKEARFHEQIPTLSDTFLIAMDEESFTYKAFGNIAHMRAYFGNEVRKYLEFISHIKNSLN